MKNITFTIIITFLLGMVTFLGYRLTTVQNIYPTRLINEATIYTFNPGMSGTPVISGKLIKVPEDSVVLSSKQTQKIIEIAAMDFSNTTLITDCFEPSFVVIYAGGHHNYVGHTAVSISCQQLLHTDNQGYNVLTDEQIEKIKELMNELDMTVHSSPGH